MNTDEQQLKPTRDRNGDEDADFDASASDLSRESVASVLTDMAMGGAAGDSTRDFFEGRKSSGHGQSRGETDEPLRSFSVSPIGVQQYHYRIRYLCIIYDYVLELLTLWAK